MNQTFNRNKVYIWQKVGSTFFNFFFESISSIKINKSTVMQIKKALINDCLCVWKASWKFCIPTIYNFAVIYTWSSLFSFSIVFYSLVSIVFSVCNLKTRTELNAKISVFGICVEAIIYLLLYNLHGCTFKNGSKRFHFIFAVGLQFL